MMLRIRDNMIPSHKYNSLVNSQPSGIHSIQQEENMKQSSKTTGQIIRSHTITYFNILNFILAGLIILSGQYKNMLFMGIVISNSLIGIIQELKVKKLIDALSVITATKAKRVEGGQIREIPIEDLRIGDQIRVSTGDQIVSDCTVRHPEGLEVNESLLTGESLPVAKKTGDFLYSGSFVVAGNGLCEVVHTGSENYATQLIRKAQTKKRATSEMQDAIRTIIKYVSYALIPIGLLLYYIQRFRVGQTISDSLVNTVAGVLGMIPEGLVLLTSVSFILGVGRLARKKALVQEMEAIEALARINVLCLDKTGTITTGDLRVEEVIPLGHMEPDSLAAIMHSLAFAFDEGNATSLALQNYFKDNTPCPVTDKLPFSSQRGYMGITIDKKGAFLLGAPDILSQDKNVLQRTAGYAGQGMRVLLLASCQTLPHTREELAETPAAVKPAGLIILSDCIKEDAMDTFSFFARQGVAIKILSGDNAATVSSVGVRAGIADAEVCIDASDLPEDPARFQKEVSRHTVFGRVAPEMKQRILKAYQTDGNIVGMVGDGVNDVLALKDADCGIAMAKGADAARQSAHIVLLDSDFSSMKDIVKEGRTIIANIERVSALYLTKTIYSILLCLIFIILGRTYPFIPIQLSLIGATAIGIPSFLLTLEQQESVTTSGFLRHVLKISLPGALGLTAVLIANQLLAGVFHGSAAQISTLNVLAGGIISLMVVIRVCRPMTRRRLFICTGITLLFAAALLLFPTLFGVLPLWELF